IGSIEFSLTFTANRFWSILLNYCRDKASADCSGGLAISGFEFPFFPFGEDGIDFGFAGRQIMTLGRGSRGGSPSSRDHDGTLKPPGESTQPDMAVRCVGTAFAAGIAIPE